MSLPDFIVIGSAKCGTTSLCQALAHHPDVFVAASKEVDFFNRHYRKGMAWYEDCFKDAGGARLLGEGSPLYTVSCVWPEVPARIAKHIPGAKLFYMVRHPIDRIESMWCQHLENGDRIPDFNVAVREWRPLVDGSLYHHQLDCFRAHFPEEQMRTCFLDDFREDSAAVLAGCLDFLGLEADEDCLRSEWRANTRGDKKRHRRAWAVIRNTWAGRRLRALLGQRARDAIEGILRTTLTETPAWDTATLDWAVDQVETDAKRLLARAGKPADYWDFSAAWRAKKLQASDARSATRHAGRKAFVLAGLDYWEEE